MVTFIQLLIGFFIILFPDEILNIAGKDFIVQPETLGILLLVHLLAGFWGMSIVIMNGLGKSLYTLKMNLFSLGIALVSGYFLVPALGLVGAALSMLSYNVVSMIWNNVYLAKMGLWPYSSKLINRFVWICVLIACYVILSVGNFELNLWQKSLAYLVSLLALGLQWLYDKKTAKANPSTTH
jgi:O-antigen/teichoic acid export membrane protein